MASSLDTLAEEAAVLGQGCGECPENVEARLGIRAVEGGALAPEIGEGMSRGRRRHDDDAEVFRALVAERIVARRGDHPDMALQGVHQRIAAALAEQEEWRQPMLGQAR